MKILEPNYEVGRTVESEGSHRPAQWLHTKLFISIAIILLSIFLGLWYSPNGKTVFSVVNPTVTVEQQSHSNDIDVHTLLRSVMAKHSFLDTFNWFHETWAVEEIKMYWRPFTMQMFWVEANTFGKDHPINWLRFSFVLYVVMSGLFAWLVYSMVKRIDVTVISVVLFSLPRLSDWLPLDYRHTPGFDLLCYWKDQPDLMLNICIVTAMLLAINRKWVWSLIACVSAVCFKESGWLSFPLVGLALLFTNQLKAIPKWLYAALTLTAISLIAFRWSAGPAVFHTASHEHPEFGRYRFVALTSEGLRLSRFPVIIFGIGYLSSLIMRHMKSAVSILALLGSVFLGMYIESYLEGLPFDDFIYNLMHWDLPTFFLIFGSIIWWIGVYFLYENPSLRNWAIIFFCFALVIALPSLISQTAMAPHCIVLPRMFQSVFVACMASAAWLDLSRHKERHQARSA